MPQLRLGRKGFVWLGGLGSWHALSLGRERWRVRRTVDVRLSTREVAARTHAIAKWASLALAGLLVQDRFNGLDLGRVTLPVRAGDHNFVITAYWL